MKTAVNGLRPREQDLVRSANVLVGVTAKRVTNDGRKIDKRRSFLEQTRKTPITTDALHEGRERYDVPNSIIKRMRARRSLT